MPQSLGNINTQHNNTQSVFTITLTHTHMPEGCLCNRSHPEGLCTTQRTSKHEATPDVNIHYSSTATLFIMTNNKCHKFYYINL